MFRKVKILFFSPPSLKSGGGGERWLLEVTRGLSRLGCKTEIVTTSFMFKDVGKDESMLGFFKDIGIEVIELPYIRPPFGGLMLPRKSLTNLLRLVKDVDVTYFIYSFIFQDMTMMLMKHLTGKPVVNGVHNPAISSNLLYGFYCKSIGRKIMNGFDSHHVLNSYYRDLLKAWGLKNIYLIPNGVDIERFKPLNYARKCHGKFKVLFVGRLTHRKGIDTLYEAIVMLNKKLKNSLLEFIIVGKGPCINLIKNLKSSYGNVRYLSYVPSEDLPGLYSNANVFVLPSRSECMPLVALEAQSSGLPLIASRIPGLIDVIHEGVTGSLLRPGMPKVLASCIQYYYRLWMDDYQEYLRFCKNSRENALRFNWNQIVKHIYKMLHGEVMRKKDQAFSRYKQTGFRL